MDLAADGRSLQCTYCGSRHHPEPADADGIRIVGPVASAPECPVCAERLAAASLDDHPIHVCSRCRGILVPRQTFATVVETRRALATDPGIVPRPLDRAGLDRRLTCPKCAGRFVTYPHFGPGNVILDNCVSCDVLWLDFGEIRQIVAAPGRDRGRRAFPAPDLRTAFPDAGPDVPASEPALARSIRDLFGAFLS